MILILRSAARAAVVRTSQTQIPKNRMHSSFSRERVGVAVRAGLLALRVRTIKSVCAAILPGKSSEWLQCPRLQLRGSAGFAPASLPVAERGREPKIEKEQKRRCRKNVPVAESKSQFVPRIMTRGHFDSAVEENSIAR